MNCIFICVFHQEQYVDMFYLLLESILFYGNINENTSLLVYTSTPFMNKIKQSHLFHKIEFEINDTYDTIEKACKSRLDFFELSTKKYDTILYLDTDILIKDSIQKVFDLCTEEWLYVVEEGEIDNIHDCWGKTLFGEEAHQYEDKRAFTSGILLFKNCDRIKELFQNIKKNMIERPYFFGCYDQPYIVYNTFKYKLYNKKLSCLAVNNDINSDKVIYHFPGGPGVYKDKINWMTFFLHHISTTNVNNKKHYESLCSEKQKILDALKGLILDSNLENNCFYHHHSMNLYPELYSKQLNLFWCGKRAFTKIGEIGFNAGHSCMLLLLGREKTPLQCTIFDIGVHSYTKPCLHYIKSAFQHVVFEYIEGDSTSTIPGWIKMNPIQIGTYDVIHVDGGYTEQCISNDMKHADILLKKGGIMIVNYTHMYHVHQYVDLYVSRKYKELTVLQTKGYPHRIIQKVH